MDIEPIIDRLKGEALALGLQSVDGSATLVDAMTGHGAAYPCARVVLTGEAAQPNQMIGIHRQQVAARFSVVLGVKAASANPAAPRQTIEAMRLGIMRALTGWSPPGTDAAIEYAGYALRSVLAGGLWADVQFSVLWTFRAE